MKKRISGRRAGECFLYFVIYLFLSIVALAVLYPLIYVVSAAFSPGNSVASLSITPFADGFTLVHFRELFTKTLYPVWFKNTFIVALSTAVLTVLICSLGAYAFSRFRFTFKKGMLVTFLILQIFPSFVGMIAIYVILLRFGGLDSLWGLVLVYVAGNIPYNTWLVKGYMDSISKSIDEAARIDGAAGSTVFFRVILPLARPIITFLAITSFTAPWMDFIFPKMILRSAEKQTLALGLFAFVTDKKSEFTTFAAGSLIIAVPFVIFFLFGQKLMVTSLSAAAVKE